MKKIVDRLIDLGKTISTMESCTGGGVADAITNIPNASKVFKFSAITYSNEFKIKMGVDACLIEKYTVYSIEVAKDMSKKITLFANSDYGVGITGKLKKADEDNPYGNDDLVYVSIYDKKNDIYRTASVVVTKDTREENKKMIIKVVESLIECLLFDIH